MNLKRNLAIVAIGLALSLPALAEPPDGPPSPEERARVEKKLRMHMVVELADQLSLDEKGALRVSQTLEKFGDRRHTLHEAMRKQREIVRRAADGDAEAGKALPGAITQIRDSRKQMEDLHFEQYTALAQGLTATQQAKLALFMAEMPQKLHRMAREGMKHEKRERRRGKW